MTSKFQPVIKWSGSKRSQVDNILSYIGEYNTYYEPFIGGGSVLYAVNPANGIVGDINKPLINLWNAIKSNPIYLIEEYRKMWNKLQEEGNQYYLSVRERFNQEQSEVDLLFLSRTCVNGLIRYNKNGEFNNSLHHTRPGIHPDRLSKIILDWSERIQHIEFRCCDYRELTATAKKGDIVYLDPPYFSTKGRYFGTIDYEDFIDYLYDLKKRQVRYLLSYDGTRGEHNYVVDLPKDLYKEHILIQSGSSTFRKVLDKKVEIVFESLYIG